MKHLNLSEMSGRMRLLQLNSSNLPIGAFTYSQGLEWAVEATWVQSDNELYEWIRDLMTTTVTYLDIPVLYRLYQAYTKEDMAGAEQWIASFLANRETSELREEEHQRGRAFVRLLSELDLPINEELHQQLAQTQLAGYAYAAAQWKLETEAAIQTYVWSWMENMVLGGVKLIPLGQTAGQKIIFELGNEVSRAVYKGLALEDSQIGFSCCAQAIASSNHEFQYTRLYRS